MTVVGFEAMGFEAIDNQRRNDEWFLGFWGGMATFAVSRYVQKTESIRQSEQAANWIAHFSRKLNDPANYGDTEPDTTCVICQHAYSELSNELNVQGICSDCYKAGWREAPDETCRSCQTPVTPDTSVPASQVNPSDPAGAYCLNCIKTGRFTRQEPDEYVGRRPLDFSNDEPWDFENNCPIGAA